MVLTGILVKVSGGAADGVQPGDGQRAAPLHQCRTPPGSLVAWSGWSNRHSKLLVRGDVAYGHRTRPGRHVIVGVPPPSSRKVQVGGGRADHIVAVGLQSSAEVEGVGAVQAHFRERPCSDRRNGWSRS